jgi:hypothetical protein
MFKNMANLNYASQYGRAIQTAYPYLSYYSDLWNQGESYRFRPLNGKTVYIPIVTTNGARAANRDSIDGSFSRNFDIDWQAMTLTMDREWDTLVDPLDVVETNEVATIANVTKVFNEMHKIPEQDAYMSMKLAGFAAAQGGTSTESLSAASILTEWDKALEYMTNQRVNRDRVKCKMTPAAYKLLKQATGMTRFIEVTNGIAAVDRNIAKLDGVEIMEVPADMMKTAYIFTSGWAIDTVYARQINFLLYDPDAIAAPIIYDVAMMSPGSAQTKGKDIYYERYYYDVFMLAQRGAGVYAHVGAAPSLGSLTITSVAGTEAVGDTVVTAAGNGIFGTGEVAEGLALKYSVNDAAVALTYGSAPDGTKTWVDMSANPITIESMTAGKYITVAMVNKQTGASVSGGNTTLVVKTE